ncbi:MAG: hypothetical protein MIL41_10305 [Hyphomicrobiales bacterium]|jgi:putative flippase GtrA
MNNERLQHLGAVIVSIVVVLGFALVCGIILLVPHLNDTISTVLLTTHTGGFGAVLNYWLGSSFGSKAKDQQISTLSQTISTLPPAPGVTPPNP